MSEIRDYLESRPMLGYVAASFLAIVPVKLVLNEVDSARKTKIAAEKCVSNLVGYEVEFKQDEDGRVLVPAKFINEHTSCAQTRFNPTAARQDLADSPPVPIDASN